MYVILEDRRYMEHWAEIEPVLQEFAELLGLEIAVSNPHGKAVPARTDTGWLYIRFWSTPVQTEDTRIREAFGIRLERDQWDALRPSGQGIAITDSAGTIVAEVVEGTLYVLFDLPHGPNAARLMRAIMEAIMEQYMLLQKSPEERERILREQAERERERNREAYVKECSRRLENTLKATREGIREAEQAIESAMRTITEATRKREGLRRKLFQLENSQKEYEKRFAAEFDRLLQVPGVIDVRVADGKVSVFTEEIIVEFGGQRYRLGQYRIDIFTSDGYIRVFNLKGVTPDGYHHPHVKSNGSVCLGNISEGIAKLLGSYEYSIVAQIMIEFLRNINPRDWYTSIENWPTVESAEGGEK